jgi:hypothetical protein
MMGNKVTSYGSYYNLYRDNKTLRACTVVFNVKSLKVFKGVIYKKILEPSLREETSLARKPSSNRRLTSHCTNLSSILSI